MAETLRLVVKLNYISYPTVYYIKSAKEILTMPVMARVNLLALSLKIYCILHFQQLCAVMQSDS